MRQSPDLDRLCLTMSKKIRKIKKITEALLVSCKEIDTELNEKENKNMCMPRDQNVRENYNIKLCNVLKI